MGYCEWASTDPLNTTYHDNEWGIPVHDDRQMFEHLTLENLQCGLSWLIVLRKRDIFRQCFDNFDYDKVAAYDDADVERIMNTEGMIRSPRKIQAVISNAQCCQKLRDEFGSLCDYFGASPAVRPSSIRPCQRTDPGQQRLVGQDQQGFEEAGL